MQKIAFTTLITGCFVLLSCTKEDEPQLTPPVTEPPTKPCYCNHSLIGYFEMEDCIIYLPIEPPFTCQGYDLLEIAVNFEMHRVTFRSTEYRFCNAPIELWTYKGNPTPAAPWSCEAVVVSAQLDFNGHELDLELDENFLLCAYEEEDGFWFALAVE